MAGHPLCPRRSPQSAATAAAGCARVLLARVPLPPRSHAPAAPPLTPLLLLHARVRRLPPSLHAPARPKPLPLLRLPPAVWRGCWRLGPATAAAPRWQQPLQFQAPDWPAAAIPVARAAAQALLKPLQTAVAAAAAGAVLRVAAGQARCSAAGAPVLAPPQPGAHFLRPPLLTRPRAQVPSSVPLREFSAPAALPPALRRGPALRRWLQRRQVWESRQAVLAAPAPHCAVGTAAVAAQLLWLLG